MNQVVKRAMMNPDVGNYLDAAAVDALVGSYAALGAADLRSRRRKRIAMAALAGSCIVAIGLWGRADWPVPFADFSAGSRFAEMQAAVEARLGSEIGKIHQERQALEAQRRELDLKMAGLTRQLAQFEQYTAQWEQQRRDLGEQSARLALAIEAVEADRQNYLAASESRPTLDEELRAIVAEREVLDRRRSEIVVADSAIDTELDELKRQRQVVETQRQELERQKAELEALLFSGDEKSAVQDSVAQDSVAQDSVVDGNVTAGNDVAIMAMVNDADLEDMRAGFSIGDGMTVSLGLTRTASLNGVEQISNSIELGAIGAGISSNELGNLGGFVLQTGSGNVIGSQALDSLSAGYGSVIQNTLDDQTIRTETIYDLRIQDVSGVLGGLSAGQALDESLWIQQ